ncbi:MAG: flagellar hook-length control protein FliK [Planctomycetota bacterium]|jgi:flagellar hook-length control protein FliK
MISGSLSVDNLFAGHAGLFPTSPMPSTSEGSHFVPPDTNGSDSVADFPPIDSTPPAEPADIEKTDNTPPPTQNMDVNKRPQDFSSASPERTTTEKAPVTQDGRKTEKKTPPGTVDDQPKVPQPWLAQYSANIPNDKGKAATKVVPKTVRQLAQLLSDSAVAKSPHSEANTPKPLVNKPLPGIVQSKTASEVVLSAASRKPITANSLPGESQNTDTIPSSNKAPFATGIFADQQSRKQLTPEAPVDATNQATTEKPATAQTTQSAASHKMPQQADIELMPEVPEKSVGSHNEKALAPDIHLSTAQAKSAESSSKPVPAGLEGSADATEDQPNSTARGAKTTSALSGKNGKESHPVANGSTSSSPLNKPNTPESQLSTSQNKDQGSPTSRQSSGPDFEPTALNNNAQPTIAERLSDTFAQTTRATNNMPSRPAPAGISDQILESIHSSLRQGEQQITIRLNPPELGKVFIKLQEQQDQITGLLEVSRIQTRYEIEHELPNMIRTLQEAGIQIKRLDVVVSDQPEQETFRDQSLPHGSFQQNEFADGSNHGKTSADEWLTSDAGFQESAEPQILTADGSINMLV